MKIYSLFLIIILSISLINAIGVTGISPTEVSMYPEETADFQFKLTADTQDLSCSFNVNESFPFSIEFEQSEIILESEQSQYIKGTITPQTNTPGQYTEKLCVYCEPTVESQAGSQVTHTICTSQFNIQILERPGLDNFYRILLVTIIVLIILVSIILYLVYSKKK